MNIDVRKIAELRKVGDKLGREGVSKLAQEFIAEYDGSYKGAMELAGKMQHIAKMATFDIYWLEQASRGSYKALMRIERDL